MKDTFVIADFFAPNIRDLLIEKNNNQLFDIVYAGVYDTLFF